MGINLNLLSTGNNDQTRESHDCQSRESAHFLPIVYFFRILSAKCLLFPLIREKVSGRIGKVRKILARAKYPMVTFSGIQLFCQLIDFQYFENRK